MWIALAATALGQVCPATRASLADAVSTADRAFADMDPAAFAEASAGLDARVDCLAERLTPEDAAGVHRVKAFAAFVAEDGPATEAALRAMLACAPSSALPEGVAPPGAPLDLALGAARAAGPGPSSPLAQPRGFELVVDGVPGGDLPAERPIVLQRAQGARVESAAWVAAGAELPAWARDPVSATPARRPRWLLVAAGASAVASGGAYALAWVERRRFDDPETPMEDLAGLRARTDALVVVSAVFGGAAVGAGSAAVATWSR